MKGSQELFKLDLLVFTFQGWRRGFGFGIKGGRQIVFIIDRKGGGGSRGEGWGRLTGGQGLNIAEAGPQAG